MRKIALIVFVLLVVIVVGLIIAVPILVNIDRFRPQLIATIQEGTGKRAEIGHLALTLFPAVSIRVDDFALENPPGFPPGYVVKAQRIYAVVDARALWHRQVVIQSVELDRPVINLLSNARGKWNFESPSKPRAVVEASSRQGPLFSLGVISKVQIKGGRLMAASLLPSGAPGPAYFGADGVSSELEQVDLNAFVGSAPARLGGLFPASPPFLAAFPNADSTAYAAPSSSPPAAEGTLRADTLRLGAIQATAVKSKVRLFSKQVYFDSLSLELYGGRATGNLSFNFAGENPRYNTHVRVKDVDVAKLLEAFPDARGKMTGKMEGDLSLTGEVARSSSPLAGMRGKGGVAIRNGNLPSLQLNRNLMQLARLSNLGAATGDPSSFSSLTADLNIANQRISSNKIVLVGNGVDVDGSGSVLLAGEGSLDCDGIAQILAERNPITDLLAGLSGATYADGKLSFPFGLSGTLQNPRFRLKSLASPNPPASLQNVPGAPAQSPQTEELVRGIGRLFKKKTSEPPRPNEPQR